MECKICQQSFDVEKTFHFHIARKHKMKIEGYYRLYYPRKDLLTGDGIKFKNLEFYFSSLFNTRENMLRYFSLFVSERLSLVDRILKLRKRVKKLIFAPCTVEAKTCILPTPELVKGYGMDYNALCEGHGMSARYKYSQPLEFEDDKDMNILIDTREQKPINFGCETIVSKLDFGDYTTRSHYKNIFIERKSLIDLCGTISQGYERLKREFERAKEFSSYIVVCVEEPISSLMSIRHLPETRMVKASSEFIAHRVREICQEYPNVQFVFMNSRKEMATVAKNILLLKNDIHTVDLQFEYDLGNLTT